MSAAEFLRWLDIIPGRNWLALAGDPAAYARLIRAGCAPSGVTELRSAAELDGLESGGFDVAIADLSGASADVSGVSADASGASADVPGASADVSGASADVSAVILELRRVIWPGGTVGALVSDPVADLERAFRGAGLHAVQTRRLADGSLAVKGTR